MMCMYSVASYGLYPKKKTKLLPGTGKILEAARYAQAQFFSKWISMDKTPLVECVFYLVFVSNWLWRIRGQVHLIFGHSPFTNNTSVKYGRISGSTWVCSRVLSSSIV